MKAALRYLLRTFCLFLVAVALLVAVFAFCGVFVWGIIWLQEGRLLPDDKQFLVKAATWFGGACLFMYLSWQVAKLAGETDDSLRLRKTSPIAEQRDQKSSVLVIFLLFGTAQWCGLSGSAIVKLTSLAGCLILFFLGLHLRIFVHELGHFVAAWMMKFDLRKMQVGTGRHLWSHSFANGFQFEWRTWPIGGFMVATDPRTTNFRMRQFIFIAAGPFSDVMILWIAYRLIFWSGFSSVFLHDWRSVTVSMMIILCLITTLAGLMPRVMWIGDRKLLSDGYWLWLLVTTSKKRIAALTAQIFLESVKVRERPDWFELAPVLAARTNPTTGIETFREQQLRLSSRLLANPRPN